MSESVNPKQFEQGFRRKLTKMRAVANKLQAEISEEMVGGTMSIEKAKARQQKMELLDASLKPMMDEIADLARMSREKMPPIIIHLTCQDDCDRLFATAKTLHWTWKDGKPIEANSVYFLYEQDTCVVINTNSIPFMPPYLTLNSCEIYKATTFEIHDFAYFKECIKAAIGGIKQKPKPLKVVIDDDL